MAGRWCRLFRIFEREYNNKIIHTSRSSQQTQKKNEAVIEANKLHFGPYQRLGAELVMTKCNWIDFYIAIYSGIYLVTIALLLMSNTHTHTPHEQHNVAKMYSSKL